MFASADRGCLQDRVEFIVNAPFSKVLELLSKASIGLSTMIDEHFGINIVEYMVLNLEFSATFWS